MTTSHVFAKVNGKLARWDLAQPTDVDEAIAAVIEADNPPRPVLALVLGQQEKRDADPS